MTATTAAAGTSVPAAGPRRLRLLLAAIRAAPGEWRTGDVVELYRHLGIAPQRSTARHDLERLSRQCRLTRCGPDNDRLYTLPTTTTGGAA